MTDEENQSSSSDVIASIQLADNRFTGVRPTREEVRMLLDEAARLMLRMAEISNNPDWAEDLRQARIESSRLATSRRILQFIYNRMDEGAPDIEFLGIWDSRGNLQAIAMVSLGRNFLYLNLFTTAPWNIISVVVDERSVRGTGRALMELIIRYSQSRGIGRNIKLTSKREPLGFYRNLGFERDSSSSNELDLVLTPQAAEKFLQYQQERYG